MKKTTYLCIVIFDDAVPAENGLADEESGKVVVPNDIHIIKYMNRISNMKQKGSKITTAMNENNISPVLEVQSRAQLLRGVF